MSPLSAKKELPEGVKLEAQTRVIVGGATYHSLSDSAGAEARLAIYPSIYRSQIL